MVVLQEGREQGYLVCPSMEVSLYATTWISPHLRVSFVFLVHSHLAMNTDLFLSVAYTGIQASRRRSCCDQRSGPVRSDMAWSWTKDYRV